MVEGFHKRFGVPGILALIALVFAMSGGAYAITNDGSAVSAAKADGGEQNAARAGSSVKCKGKGRIKRRKKVNVKVKCPQSELVGPVGPQGPEGQQGPQGPKGEDGAQGEQGPAGPVGPAGPAGADGADGAQGPQGPAGDPWTAGGTLPAGATQTGAWSYTLSPEQAQASADLPIGAFLVPISFSVPIPNSMVEDDTRVHFQTDADFGETCTGTAANPSAPNGQLCIYAADMSGFGAGLSTYQAVLPPSDFGVVGMGRTGGLIGFAPPGGSPPPSDFGWGSWAVTGE